MLAKKCPHISSLYTRHVKMQTYADVQCRTLHTETCQSRLISQAGEMDQLSLANMRTTPAVRNFEKKKPCVRWSINAGTHFGANSTVGRRGWWGLWEEKELTWITWNGSIFPLEVGSFVAISTTSLLRIVGALGPRLGKQTETDGSGLGLTQRGRSAPHIRRGFAWDSGCTIYPSGGTSITTPHQLLLSTKSLLFYLTNYTILHISCFCLRSTNESTCCREAVVEISQSLNIPHIQYKTAEQPKSYTQQTWRPRFTFNSTAQLSSSKRVVKEHVTGKYNPGPTV